MSHCHCVKTQGVWSLVFTWIMMQQGFAGVAVTAVTTALVSPPCSQWDLEKGTGNKFSFPSLFLSELSTRIQRRNPSGGSGGCSSTCLYLYYPMVPEPSSWLWDQSCTGKWYLMFLKHLLCSLLFTALLWQPELWKGRSFTFMPMPQQSKGHMRNGSSNAENVKEQDLHVILVFLLCWVLFTHSCVCSDDCALFLLAKQVKKGF